MAKKESNEMMVVEGTFTIVLGSKVEVEAMFDNFTEEEKTNYFPNSIGKLDGIIAEGLKLDVKNVQVDILDLSVQEIEWLIDEEHEEEIRKADEADQAKESEENIGDKIFKNALNETKKLLNELIKNARIDKLNVFITGPEGEKKYQAMEIIGDISEKTLSKVMLITLMSDEGELTDNDIDRLTKLLFEEGILKITKGSSDYKIVITDSDTNQASGKLKRMKENLKAIIKKHTDGDVEVFIKKDNKLTEVSIDEILTDISDAAMFEIGDIDVSEEDDRSETISKIISILVRYKYGNKDSKVQTTRVIFDDSGVSIK